MARIKNIDLPNEKHVCIGLTAIYGIGRPLALSICEDAKVEPTKKVKDLTEDEWKDWAKKGYAISFEELSEWYESFYG